MIRDTGSPRADAEADFLRARRLQVIAALTARLLRKESGDRKALSFQEVVDALHPLLERLHPRWHLHGHIHPYGQPRPDRRVGDTTIRNVIPYRMFEIPDVRDSARGGRDDP